MIWPDPTHQPTHPSTHPSIHQIIHPPMGGGVSTDFKSSNRIEISQLVQVLLNFEWFRGSLLGWVDGVGGWLYGVGMVRGCTPLMCTHTCIWHHREFPGIPPMGAAICMKLPCLPCMHVCVCACACMCTCVGGTPQPSPTPSTPHPQELQEAENTNSITLELIEIIRFCLKILYLWTFLNS